MVIRAFAWCVSPSGAELSWGELKKLQAARLNHACPIWKRPVTSRSLKEKG